MAYSPHSAQSAHKYDAGTHSSTGDYTSLDHGPSQKDIYEALGKDKYDAIKDYMKNEEEKLLDKNYQSKEAEEDKKKKDKDQKDSIEKNIEREEQKEKYKSSDKEVTEEDLKKKAVDEIRSNVDKNKEEFKAKKNLKTIEEAIQKAIKEEKEVLQG